MQEKDSSVYFGHRTVSIEEKQAGVQSVFGRVFKRYDLMNDLMSGGLHHLWKKAFCAKARLSPHMHHLDVAAGTGDIYRHLQKKAAAQNIPFSITALDYSYGMLNEGKKISIDKNAFLNLNWVTGNASALPFKNNTFDLYTIAFGLRNVAAQKEALQEAFRVLKPGGQFLCLEFSHVQSKPLNKLYKLYRENVIPKLGGLIANDKDAYQYLSDSIATFMTQDTFLTLLNETGFAATSYENLTDGIVAIHQGWKPHD